MKKLFTSIVLLSLTLLSTAQKEANIWYFGNGAGLDFNGTTCAPTALNDGKIDGYEGAVTISDKNTGQLLFYTNSDSVWDRTHHAMAGGRLVLGGKTITQAGIVQKPLSSSLYYIITTEIQGYSGQGLRFHQVDMSLNGGLGDLSFKDSVLYPTPVTEKIALVRHSNGIDVWVITHKYNSNQFMAFLMTSTGISTTPVISATGKIHYGPGATDPIGEMKASPNGSKLSVVTLYSPNIELFDFDKTTGIVSNPITLPENGAYDGIGNSSGLYGITFSPNNRLLYVGSWKMPLMSGPIPGRLIQYDVTSNDSATINNSRVDIVTSFTRSFYGLQLGPDRRIYVGNNYSNYLGIIEYPDSAGLACSYVENGIYLGGKTSGWGLNNVLNYNFCSDQPLDITTAGEASSFSMWPNPANHVLNIEVALTGTWQWSIADLSGRIVRTGELREPGPHLIDIDALLPGVYTVSIANHQNPMVKKLVVE